MLISWPILIYAGLPISIMSPLGNLLFTPIITIYLLLASLIFFSELLFIPNGYLIIVLEKITKWWVALMKLNSSSWLIGVPSTSIFFLFLVPLIVIASMYYKPWSRQKKNILILFAYMICFGSVLCLFKKGKAPFTAEIMCVRNQKVFYCVAKKKALIVSATGLQSQMIEQWMDYNLLPEMLKRTGSPSLDYLVVMVPKKTSFELAHQICARALVNEVYVHTWKNEDKNISRAYIKMKKQLLSHGGHLYYFTDDLHLNMGRNYNLELSPKKQFVGLTKQACSPREEHVIPTS